VGEVDRISAGDKETTHDDKLPLEKRNLLPGKKVFAITMDHKARRKFSHGLAH